MKSKTSRFGWFWPLILIMALLRLALSLYLLKDSHYFFTLSADDVARYRIALLWAGEASFFPDPTWPPLPFWLGGLLVRLFSAGPATLCGISIAASMLSIPLLGLLCLGILPQTGTGKKTQQLFAVGVTLAVFVFYPRWIWLGTSMLAESLYSFLMLLSFTIFILAIEKKTVRWAFLALIIPILASMTRLEGAALTGIIYLLLVWRLRNHSSKSHWALFIVFGALMAAAFPAAWIAGHSGGSGAIDYFTALKGGFTSQYTHNPFRTPINLLRIYLSVFPLILFMILIGWSAVWSERKKTGYSGLLSCQIALVTLYVFAQCAASAMGMMPTHTFWRLTVPVFVLLLPFVGAAFVYLGQFIPLRMQILPAALCVFYLFPAFAHPPRFVTPDMYKSSIDIKEVRSGQQPEGNILMEVAGWEWLPLSVLSNGPHFDGILFDRDPHKRQATNLNPPVFNRPNNVLSAYLETNNVNLCVVKSLPAKQKMMALGWNTERSGRYALFTPPDKKQP